ncbi:MAG TPA: glycosyltransferase, partial [Gemmatimonadales bacterium]|nr:glycosyltransferase [Gemmatimonadales bacterium]
MELSLVVPAYNERDNLAPLLEEIAAALDGAVPSYEVIVVDDGSTDGTLEALKTLRRQYPQLHIISFERNAGQTAAFSAGFRAAHAPIVVTLDADLQNDP